jgi:hypothetical protein
MTKFLDIIQNQNLTWEIVSKTGTHFSRQVKKPTLLGTINKADLSPDK